MVRRDAAIFEGVFDFVSALVYHGHERPAAPVLVLNSTGLAERGLERLQAVGIEEALLYLDHDESGERVRERFILEGPVRGIARVRDMSVLYAGYKDMNEFLLDGMTDRARSLSRQREVEDDHSFER